ncbi:integrase catalytic domain-containing protein [Trichonephila inaurata madagascariensis]|uniref:Integrase catalytic domain-containing protein n=1 Tax=Trichonephila inaurata madagascariensis TaxID=2747483 RepID=A0A8X6Y1Q8_9ARAC|nr:integrase catalytic domain-containing protein [Trichonephila inaurata madagascariensis]
MDALKLRRTPLRTAFTKAVNHLQEIIENDPVDMNAVETAFEQLKVKSAKLKEVEDAVLDLMIESNCTQEAYNIEFEAIEGYAEKMIAWQVRVKNIMKTDALGQKDNHSLVTSSSSSLRLPKIQFQQFSGELTDWLRRASLYYEELNTVLCECEHVINSRPLTYISEDVNDLSPLTPAMFLQEIETSDVTDIDCLDHQEINKRIRNVQTIREQLRKRFRIEYLGQLREQTQRHRKSRPLTVGEVVVVENSLKNRTLWSLARVIQLIPGKDGHIRVARVKTETGELVRPVQRLYNLELQEPEINLPKDLTDSVIRTRRGRKVTSPKRLTYA